MIERKVFMDDAALKVEVAFAAPDRQQVISLKVPLGTTVYEAVVLAKIAEYFPEYDLDALPMGIFGKVESNPKKRELKPEERVEIYRPLLVDPKIRRLNKAKK